MKIVTRQSVNDYLKNDIITNRLDAVSCPDDENLVCQRWLRETPAKRYIFESLYGDLFLGSQRLRILDIGGGLTSFTRGLAKQHDYILADLLAHDNIDVVNEMSESVGREFVIIKDWLLLKPSHYDLVVANDLFPNVDQRLEIFLERFLPQASRIKILLTWYDTPRFYKTKRIDAEEIFYVLAWDSCQLKQVLNKFSSRILSPNIDCLSGDKESIYPNGRQVCLVEFVGDLRS